MSGKTAIEWTETVWNPVRGCTRVSEGCRHCYAERHALRFSGPGQPYEGLVHKVGGEPRWTGQIRLVQEALTEPLRWRTPRRVFVNSMSDLFHDGVPDDFIWEVFAVMAACPQHTFQALTKRPARMQAMLSYAGAVHKLDAACEGLAARQGWCHNDNWTWPLPNVWLGVSVEDQNAAEQRIPLLLQTPAAIRWISAEPLLGPIDLDSESVSDLLHALGCGYEGGWRNCPEYLEGRTDCAGLDWVVVGGESGPGARPMHPDWSRRLRDDCVAAGVPFFFKQWGEYCPAELDHSGGVFDGYWRDQRGNAFHQAAHGDPEQQVFQGPPVGNYRLWPVQRDANDPYVAYIKLGKKWSGARLDRREWREYPRQEVPDA